MSEEQPNGPAWIKVEKVDRNPDGTVTVYAKDDAGDPYVRTYQSGETVTRIKRDVI